MKFLGGVIIAIILLYAWNSLTCQFCAKDRGGGAATNGTAQQCAIHGQKGYITRSFVWTSWQVNVYIPGLGCFSNNPTPIYIGKFPITTWAKGFHRVPIINMRLQ